MAKRYDQVAHAFLKRQKERAGNMTTAGGYVFSYAEMIATKEHGEVHITTQKHSRTTSAHTSAIRNAVAGAGYIHAHDGEDGRWQHWVKVLG